MAEHITLSVTHHLQRLLLRILEGLRPRQSVHGAMPQDEIARVRTHLMWVVLASVVYLKGHPQIARLITTESKRFQAGVLDLGFKL